MIIVNIPINMIATSCHISQLIDQINKQTPRLINHKRDDPC